MDEYGLIGRTLGHSFSAAYFGARFRATGADACYLNFELPAIEALPHLLASRTHLRGFNVTIPYKEAVMPYLSSLTDEAREVGAVNCVKVEADGSLAGHNTDMEGFGLALDEFLDGASVGKALILGTGGASKAVAAALRRRSMEYVKVSRRPQAGCVCYDMLPGTLMPSHRLIVNATPLGTWPDVETLPEIPYDEISGAHYCFDLVYNPEVTAFMRSSAVRGAAVCNGLGMLRRQAEGAARWWKV